MTPNKRQRGIKVGYKKIETKRTLLPRLALDDADETTDSASSLPTAAADAVAVLPRRLLPRPRGVDLPPRGVCGLDGVACSPSSELLLLLLELDLAAVAAAAVVPRCSVVVAVTGGSSGSML